MRSVPVVRRVYKNGLTIFLYHDVTDTPSRFAEEFGLAVPKKLFALQISWITKNFNVIHPLALLKGEPLPEDAALITFDDGFHGTFANGLEHLENNRIPSVVFLNMQPIIEQKPIVSAIACYRERYMPEYKRFIRTAGMSGPFHLTCTPELLDQMNDQFGGTDLAAINEYQGRFADFELVRRYAKSGMTIYGNHLYEHWNSIALTPVQFAEQYNRNKIALAEFKNSAEMFAFPNGQPGRCFTKTHIDHLLRLGSKRVFSGVGGINRIPNNYLLGRMTLNARDNSEDIFWCRLLRAVNC